MNYSRLYEVMADHAGDLICVVDRLGTCIACNIAFAKGKGLLRNQILGRNVADLWDQQFYRDYILPLLTQTLSGSESHFESKFALGIEPAVFEVVCSPYQDEASKEPCAVIVLRDISAYKKSEQALRQSEERYKEIISNVHDIIYRTDRNGVITFISTSVVVITGYTSEELVGTQVRRLYETPSDREKLIAGIAEAGSVRDFHIRMIRKDGNKVWASINASFYYDEAGTPLGIQGSIRDVTDRVEHDEEIRKLNRELEERVSERTQELNRINEDLRNEVSERKKAQEDAIRSLDRQKELGELKNRFISMISHEFRTPLAAMKNASFLLKNADTSYPAEKRMRQLAVIEESIGQMTRLLEQVLSFERHEADVFMYKPEPLDAAQFLINIVDSIESAIGMHRIRVSTAGIGQQRVIADRQLLRTIMENLISNALKYSPQQETVKIESSIHNGRLIIAVEDNGIGIPPKDRPVIFEPFHRAMNVGNIKGHGLGLSIVQRAVAAHKGEITFVCPEKGGTIFLVQIPVVPVPEGGK